MSILHTIYAENIKTCQRQLEVIKKRINLLSIGRLLGFILSVLLFIKYFQDRNLPVLLGAWLFVVVFVWLVILNLRLKEKWQLQMKLLFINNNELQVLENQASLFDDGHLAESQETYLDDLDIFGKNSVFHVLNRTTTSHGAQRLVCLLGNPLMQKEEIVLSQEAIKTLCGQISQRQLLTARGLLHEEESGNLFSVSEWLKGQNRLIQNRWVMAARWILPAYSVFGALYYLATDQLQFMLTGFALCGGVTGYFVKYINLQHRLISKKQEILEQYASILLAFQDVEAGSSVKISLLKIQAFSASQSIATLSRLSSWFDQRLNLLVAFFGNLLILYDIQCMIGLESWKNAHRNHFEAWIEVVGEIETLNSLATYAYNNKDYTYPQLLTGPLKLEATQISHPLIPSGQRIPNDFAIGTDDRLQLITGSNMSGKTTFLRTLGVNLLLAQCGLPVCATSFSFTPMMMLTSMRVNDSLQEHTSYFMAELKKLQFIVHQLQKGMPALVLIDEILRGTNSEDKTFGSEQFIKKLLQYNCLSFFATHDLSLSRLEAEFPGVIRNFCFESLLDNNELQFDYKLRSGVAKNRNASFLMKKMEII